MTGLEFFAYGLVIMIGAALNPKALGLSLVAVLILIKIFPDQDIAKVITTAYVGLNIVSGFRD